MYHVAEFLAELSCRQGPCVIYTTQKNEIERYMGQPAAREIEALALSPEP